MQSDFDPWPQYESSRNRRFVHAYGQLDQNWRHVERAIEFLIWQYLGASRLQGEAVTTHMRASKKEQKLRGLVKAKEQNEGLSRLMVYALDQFSIARTSRNLIAHSSPGGIIGGRHFIFVVLLLKGGVVERRRYNISLEELRGAADGMRNLHFFLLGLLGRLRGWTAELPAISMPQRNLDTELPFDLMPLDD